MDKSIVNLNQAPADPVLAKKLRVAVWVVTVLVWGLVAVMRRPEKIPLPAGVSLAFLPAVHAALNTLVAICLVLALVMIKRRNIGAHRRFISAAMVASGVFLLCYVAYHFTTAETKFGGTGGLRYVYFGLLISHIVLAAVSLPFILQTWVFAYTNHFARHRAMARWVFPLWLYVAITGPVCYLLLRPYY